MIKAIFAVDIFGGMGAGGTLPWPSSREDFAWFKRNTQNQVVVMGRRTWDDPKMPKPLPNRINYVISHTPVDVPGVVTISGDYTTQIASIQSQYPESDVYILGGPVIIMGCIDQIEKIYLTTFRTSYIVDTRIDLKHCLRNFDLVDLVHGSDCTFSIYERIPR